LTLHTTLTALRLHGIDIASISAPTTNPALQDDAWNALCTVSNTVTHLTPPQLDACAAAVARRHPLLGAMVPFETTVSSWLELVCRAWRLMHPAFRWSSVQHEDALHLSFVSCAPELEGFASLTNHVLRHAPTLIGAAPLEAAGVTPTSCTWSLETSSASQPCARHARPSDTISLHTVLRAFSAWLPTPKTPRSKHFPTTQIDHDRRHCFVIRHGLTPAEARVLRAIHEGARPADAAIALGISIATVRVHLKHIYAKTGAHTQRQLVAQVEHEAVSANAGASPCMPSG